MLRILGTPTPRRANVITRLGRSSRVRFLRFFELFVELWNQLLQTAQMPLRVNEQFHFDMSYENTLKLFGVLGESEL